MVVECAPLNTRFTFAVAEQSVLGIHFIHERNPWTEYTGNLMKHQLVTAYANYPPCGAFVAVKVVKLIPEYEKQRFRRISFQLGLPFSADNEITP